MTTITEALEPSVFSHFMMPFEPISLGNLTVRIATSPEEIEASQRLRYAVFCEEMGGTAKPVEGMSHIDIDEFDDVCDHLLVVCRDDEGNEEVVGTYRLLRGTEMPKIGRFYTEGEFDITALKKFDGNIMELGRSCVRKEFRTRPTIQLLWRGIGAYVSHYEIDLMFGCVSFAGSDVEQHREALQYLKQYHAAPDDLTLISLPQHYTAMDGEPLTDEQAKEAFKALPVLIKGYLRLGGMIGDGAFLDTEFNTTDVGIIVRFDTLDDKYISRYAPESKKH